MKRDMIEPERSGFFGVPKDLALIMRKIVSDKEIAKLLYHNTPDCLGPEYEVTTEQLEEMLENHQISALPRIKTDKFKRTYLTINFDNYIPNLSNTFYRDNTIEIRIIAHFDNWYLEDNDLRVYRIAGRIDQMLDGARLSGIGITNFIGATQDVYDDEFGGLTLNYRVVRGTEDQDELVGPMV